MTKKHFNRIAGVLKHRRPPNVVSSELAEWDILAVGELAGNQQMWQTIVHDMCDVCAESSPTFDRQRFLDACGLVNTD